MAKLDEKRKVVSENAGKTLLRLDEWWRDSDDRERARERWYRIFWPRTYFLMGLD